MINGSPCEFRDLHALVSRKPVVFAHEDRDRVATIGNGQEPIVLVDMREHRDIASVIEKVGQHVGRIAELHRQFDAADRRG